MEIKKFENFEENWEEEDDDKTGIKKLEDYTDEEKIQKFDMLYSLAKGMLEEFKNSDRGEPNEDDINYTWETVMELLSDDRVKFWEYYNSLY